MRTQFLDGVKIPLQLFYCQQLVNLGVTRAAKADHVPHRRAIEFPFVTLVVMTRSRNEVMSGQRLLAFADRTTAGHG